MRPNGEPLHIQIDVKRSGDDVVISVADDGVGMDTNVADTAVRKGSSKGAGIALKNVDDRLRSCFGKGSGISIESTLGVGTTVYLTLAGANVDAVGDGVLKEGGNQ
jgi:sensor histidine kinase YesM